MSASTGVRQGSSISPIKPLVEEAERVLLDALPKLQVQAGRESSAIKFVSEFKPGQPTAIDAAPLPETHDDFDDDGFETAFTQSPVLGYLEEALEGNLQPEATQLRALLHTLCDSRVKGGYKSRPARIELNIVESLLQLIDKWLRFPGADHSFFCGVLADDAPIPAEPTKPSTEVPKLDGEQIIKRIASHIDDKFSGVDSPQNRTTSPDPPAEDCDKVEAALEGQPLLIYRLLRSRKFPVDYKTLANEKSLWSKEECPSDTTVLRALRRLQTDLNKSAVSLHIEHKARRVSLAKICTQ